MTKACDKCRFHRCVRGGDLPDTHYAFWLCRHPSSAHLTKPKEKIDPVHTPDPPSTVFWLCEARRKDPDDICGPDGRQWMDIRWWMFWHWF